MNSDLYNIYIKVMRDNNQCPITESKEIKELLRHIRDTDGINYEIVFSNKYTIKYNKQKKCIIWDMNYWQLFQTYLYVYFEKARKDNRYINNIWLMEISKFLSLP